MSFWRTISASTLIVVCMNTVAETEFTALEVQAMSLHGPWPVSTPADPGNELSGLGWAEQTGEQLFSDSSLSKTGTLSCASCHQKASGFSDDRALASGLKTGHRNTQGLLNAGLQRWFGWDGGTDSLWSASMRPLLADHEMGNSLPQLAATLQEKDQWLTHLQRFRNSNPSVSESELNDEQIAVYAAKTIAAYTRTLRSGATPFDRFLAATQAGDTAQQAAYPEAAKRGLKLFLSDANCQVCHFGPNFSNGEFHDIGRPFFTGVGKVDPGRFTGIERMLDDPFNLLGAYAVNVSQSSRLKSANVKRSQSNWGQWRTPSLRNLTDTAPYMHDGSLKTLRDVVDFYAEIDPMRLHSQGESILKPMDWTEQDREDLVRFLESLSSETE